MEVYSQLSNPKCVYQELKKLAYSYQPHLIPTDSNDPTQTPTQLPLPSYQTMLIGLISGAMGPFSNAPIDTIKTRLQKSSYPPGTSALEKIMGIVREMIRTEGAKAFYKGITPRMLGVAPGQAVVFPVYEKVRQVIETMQGSDDLGDTYSE